MSDKKENTQPQEISENRAEPAAADAVATATAPLNQRISVLENELASKVEEMEKQKGLILEKEKGLTALATEKESAIRSYLALVQRSNPLVPAEMLNGSNIAEIDAALGKANSLVTQIRSGLEKELQITRIPPGAPGRTEPDVSGMTAREKISYGLQKVQRRSK